MTVRQIDAEQKRLGILGDDELDAIYGRPRFTHEERQNYLSLSQPEKELLQTLRSVKSQAYFVLQLGYFKAKQLFFTFDLHEVGEDLRYVVTQHFNNSIITDFSRISKVTRLKQQHMILELTNYRICDTKERQEIKVKAHTVAAVCGKPIYILRELIHYLSERHIVAPGYRFMQITVGEALTYEENRIIMMLRNNLTQPEVLLQKIWLFYKTSEKHR
jgi:Domain of unknown function (DUF4158)